MRPLECFYFKYHNRVLCMQPTDGSMSSDNDENTELMMDELLMTPPITGAAIRGLLPRRTLEPLMEEEYSESCSSSSTQTEPSASPEQVNTKQCTCICARFCQIVKTHMHCGQGSGTGDAADTCSTAAERPSEGSNNDTRQSDMTSTETNVNIVKIHRSDSYRHIIEAEDENAAFINRFNPTAKYIDIEPTPRSKTVKMYASHPTVGVINTVSVFVDLDFLMCAERGGYTRRFLKANTSSNFSARKIAFQRCLPRTLKSNFLSGY